MKKLTIIALTSFFIYGMFSCKNEDDISDTVDNIVEDYIAILTPEKEFTKIYPNTTATINWNTNISGNVSLDVFDENGSIYSMGEEIFPEDKQFIWNVPSDIAYASEARFRIRSIEKPELFSESKYPFRLGIPTQNEWVRVIEPNGGESYAQNEFTRVKWSSNSTSQVLLKVYYENTEVAYFASPQTYNDTVIYAYWTNMFPGNKYRIKASLENKPSVFDFSDTYFTITEATEDDED
ncbi:MAG: hypothetical protein PF448_10785 [Bacteroidales bacterium]|jgi:hypothetical protein|nr:hypothetical protein [Bacteroidales bacterium]